ncbi:MAG TPA: hypothetical protein VME46_01495 [Acidimicrobiales bacterium]|nr:hypothetical protein [Acidimicrobiales bacterium]
MSALVTEHFALQSISSATISESGSRAALYLSALSSGLVAIGFASASRQDLEALAFSVLPTVFILGWFTIVRLIDTSVQNIVSRRRIETIRKYYAAIDPRHARLFEPDAVAFGVLSVRYSARSVLFTRASMILLVNSVVAGATVALVVALGGGVPAPGCHRRGSGHRRRHPRARPLVRITALGGAHRSRQCARRYRGAGLKVELATQGGTNGNAMASR